MPPTDQHSRKAVILAISGAVGCGSIVAVQSRINGELGAELGDGYVAAFVSFGSGLVLLLVATLVAPTGRKALGSIRDALISRSIPWWYLLGGTAGAAFVLAQGISTPLIGVALLTIAAVAGQTVSGLIVDRIGLGTMASTRLTATRIAGSAIAVGAVVLTVSAQLRLDFPAWALVLPFLAGLALSWQQAANGQLRGIGGSAVAASFINFLAGTIVLTVVLFVHAAIAGWPTAFPGNPLLYTGGVLGALLIAGLSIAVRYTGALLLGLGALSGQLLASLLLDAFAPVAAHPLTPFTVAGTLLTLVAVAIAALPAGSKTTGRTTAR